jgi:heme/copper-type cytochrome/quinol oxidase subunit 2
LHSTFSTPNFNVKDYPPARFSGGTWWGWMAIMITIGLVIAVCVILVLGNAWIRSRRRQRGEYDLPGQVFSDDPTADDGISETTYLTDSTVARYDEEQ